MMYLSSIDYAPGIAAAVLAQEINQRSVVALGPVRLVAAIALVVVIIAGIWAARHIHQLERMAVRDDLVPRQPGARSNAVFIVGAVSFVLVCLLVFLVVQA